MTHTASAALTLPAISARAVSVQAALLLAAAWLLPAAAHAAGLPVRLLLPMHWPVLLAGLCYGWRSGAVVGLAAPAVSVMLSGHPSPAVLPAMTVELGTYGLLAGLGIQGFGLGRRLATLTGVLGGRMVFIAAVLATGAAAGPLVPYLRAALLPGLAAMVGQIVLLPWLAGWWVRREQAHR